MAIGKETQRTQGGARSCRRRGRATRARAKLGSTSSASSAYAQPVRAWPDHSDHARRRRSGWHVRLFDPATWPDSPRPPPPAWTIDLAAACTRRRVCEWAGFGIMRVRYRARRSEPSGLHYAERPASTIRQIRLWMVARLKGAGSGSVHHHVGVGASGDVRRRLLRPP